MAQAYCYSCMKPLGRPDGKCPHCGCGNAESAKSQPAHALPCGTVLNKRYLVGRVLGQGGFGITYIGFDLLLELRVCIKEYFPNGAAMRSGARGGTVYWNSGTLNEELKRGRDSFLTEARKAVRLRDLKSVVKVWDVFYCNETAYIIMEYIEGVTLRRHLQSQKRPMEATACFRALLPMMRDLDEIHKRDIVHRDISPDNIIVRPDGGLTLVDLGAAKDLSLGHAQASRLVTKQGFSPMEQYATGGRIGPWTDVYSISATLYTCVTGRYVPSPMDRSAGVKPDLSMFSPPVAAVLEQGLGFYPKDRIQDMATLSSRLSAAFSRSVRQVPAPRKTPAEQIQPVSTTGPGAASKTGKGSRGRKTLLYSLAVVAALLVLTVGFILFRAKTAGQTVSSEPSLASVSTRTPGRENLAAYNILRADRVELSEANGHGARAAVFGSRVLRRQISEIRVLNTQDGMPQGAWDASEAGDGSVMAWTEPDGELLRLSIAGRGGITAPADCGMLFAGYTNLRSVWFNGSFHTGDTVSMKQMFANCPALTSLSLRGLDTANVTDMRGMFYGCRNLKQIDLKGLSTGNVTDMTQMFCHCESLEAVDVSGFNTSRVVSMSGMFYNCTALRNVDLSSLDTASVEQFYNFIPDSVLPDWESLF